METNNKLLKSTKEDIIALINEATDEYKLLIIRRFVARFLGD